MQRWPRAGRCDNLTKSSLLNHRRNPENVLAAELYDEVVAKRVPVEEWPQFVHLRMSGGEPLSASAADNGGEW